jgi:thymidylate synthase ThyX
MSDIFCLTDETGELLPPAVQATVLAKYSRSALSAREIVKTLSEEEANKFQDKWFVTWGHSSVAELSTIPICFEGVSIVASKFIEKYQRPGYSEKSTRYQDFSSLANFVSPPGTSLTLKRFVERYYDAYKKLYPGLWEHCAKLSGKDPSLPETKHDKILQARVFDNLRYLIPAGSGTSLGMCAFGRDIRYLVRDAISSPNAEIREIGVKTQKAVMDVCPPFVNNVEEDFFEPDIMFFHEPVQVHPPRNGKWDVRICDPDLNSKKTEDNFKLWVSKYYGHTWESFSARMGERKNRSVPRIFRKVKISFDIIMDYGAYRDLQRHRRCEQYSEKLSTNFGYVVPDDIIGTEFEGDYKRVMDSTCEYRDESSIFDPDLNQYHIPIGYLHRSVFDMDLEELYYMVELRTKPQGHISYRRIAYKMFELAKEKYPQLMQWCRAVPPNSIGDHK